MITIKSLSNNLGSNPIFIHSNEMKRKSNSESYYECTFSGVQFQVFGTYDKSYTIYLDHKYHATVNFVSTNNSQPQYTSRILPYGKHIIELVGADRDFIINKIAYVQSSNRLLLNYTEFERSDWTEWTVPGSDEKVIYARKYSNQISISIRCSKFWIYGIKDSSQGLAGVKFGDLIDDEFNEYSQQSQYYSHVVYESPDFPLTSGELNIYYKDEPNRAHSVTISYIEILAEPLPYPASEPISVSVDAMTGKKDSVYLVDCKDVEIGVTCGEVAIEPSAGGIPLSLEYTFKGVRFQVYGTFGPGFGSYRIILDGLHIETISQSANEKHIYALQYTSDILTYGDHTIRIEADLRVKVEIYKFTYTLSLQAKRIDTSLWKGCKPNINDLGGYYYYSPGGEAFRSQISCSEYWIIGDCFTDSGFGTVTSSFAGNSISESAAKKKQLFTIYIESGQFKYSSEEFVISSRGPAAYHYIYIIDEPDPEIPISVPITEMNPEGTINCKNDDACSKDSISTVPCGERCWSTKDKLLTLKYKFKGVRFQFYGTTDNNHRRFSIYLNDTFHAKCLERFGDKRLKFTLFFTSDLLPYGEHAVMIQSTEVFELSKMTYWVSLRAKRIDSTLFSGKENWEIQSDLVGNFQLKANQNPLSINRKIYASRFWIIGSGKNLGISVEYQDESKTKEILTSEKFAVIYESSEFQCNYENLLITANNQGVIINCVYIFDENCPPQPTEFFSKSDVFSVSEPFSNSLAFPKTVQFSSSGQFSISSPFSKSNVFSETGEFSKSGFFSQSSKFSRSNFFLETDKFSRSNLFSETGKFSKSNFFSETGKFSRSGFFSQSSKFSRSNFFLETDKFSRSNFFSETGKFSRSGFFSQSNKFSRSNFFSETDKFSRSGFFSQSNKFSRSNFFTETGKFSRSGFFSQSSKFSRSNFFSETDKFSRSDIFSQPSKIERSDFFSRTVKFSRSDFFSRTDKFSRSDFFSRTDQFSKSDFFSRTDQFSKSDFFSRTDQFSKSDFFSRTEKFSKSDFFSRTDQFSKSDFFSKSDKFTSSFYFSKTAKFTQSDAFTKAIDSPSEVLPSEEPSDHLPGGITCGVFDDDEYFQIDICKYTVSVKKLVYVIVLSDNFANYKQNEDGSAINLINCGLLCNNTKFVECVSLSGAGGAIYIKNSFDITNNATFINSSFSQCKASYGGAVYLSVDSGLFDISFTRCIFESNEALIKIRPTGQSNQLFGGDALYAICSGISIINSSFLHHKGGYGAIKIINHLNSNSKNILLERRGDPISFVGCTFEQHENSKSSIYLVDENSMNQVDIFDCEFKGKIKKGSHYIDGNFNNKEKLNVKSCKFESDENEAINIESINNAIQIKADLSYFSSFTFKVIIMITVLITLLVLAIIKLTDSKNGTLESQNSFNKELKENKNYNDQNSLI